MEPDIIAMLEKHASTLEAFQAKHISRVDAIEAELKAMALKAARPPAGVFGGLSAGAIPTEERKALEDGLRALLAGDKQLSDEKFMQAKAMSVGTDSGGGYVVHPLLSSGLTKAMADISPLYSLARVIPLDKADSYEEPIDAEQAEAAWVGEQQARNETGTPGLGLFRVDLKEICATPKITQKLIDVASMNIIAWMQEKVGEAFGVKEGNSYHWGDGVAQARGFLTYDTSTAADASRPWGTVQYVFTGVSGGFASPSATVSPADKLIDLTLSLRKQYRDGATWLMNSNTAGAVRKFKDAEGRFVWTDSIVAGQPPMLLGYPVEIDEEMPDIAANSLSIAFGNFKRAYTIIEMPGIRFLPDPYSAKPNVLLYSYRRVGGGLNNSQAVKLLKFGTS